MYTKINYLLLCVLCPMIWACSTSESDELSTADSIAETLWNRTDCREFSQERLEAMSDMQVYGDLCENTIFQKYLSLEDETLCRRFEQGSGLLEFYNDAFEKVLREVPGEIVPQGSVKLWQIYNMGYVVKTPEHCFGIDIYHKHAAKIAAYLDFALITHKHDDHYTDVFVEAMTSAGKPVYSNFLENDYRIDTTMTIDVVGDVTMITNIVDHGMAHPSNFVVSYEIDCGASSGNTVIFHIGDCGNYTHLNPVKEVDIFIPHLAVSLDMDKAVNERVKPKMLLMSHIMEMGHPTRHKGYRWSYDRGVQECLKIDPETNFAYLPVWGEMIEYKRK